MLKKILGVFLSLTLFSLAMFFVVITVYLFNSQVIPAIAQGSIIVRTNIMILNHVWEGSEIYILLAIYALLAAALFHSGIRLLKKALAD